MEAIFGQFPANFRFSGALALTIVHLTATGGMEAFFLLKRLHFCLYLWVATEETGGKTDSF